MKFLVVFAFCIVAASAGMDPELKAQIMEFMRETGAECAKQENASPEDVANIVNKIVPESREGQCMLACFNEKIGVQSADGKMSMEGAMKTIEMLKDAPDVHTAMTTLFQRCIPETESLSDRCEVAAKFANCGCTVARELGLDAAIL